MKHTKKSLLASGLSLLVCAALLVGTTFAWFTDSVSNKGNSIQAGSLLINAYAYDLGTGGQTCTIPGVNNGQAFTFEATAQDLKTDTTPIISEPMWEPGASSAKLLQVTNTGNREGATVIQLYLQDVTASMSRPVKMLRGFKKVTLKPGETQTVSFPIDVDALKFWNQQMKYVAEPGKFNVFIGVDSARVKQSEFELL